MMKKILLIISFLFAISRIASAQSEIGLKGGFNYSEIYDKATSPLYTTDYDSYGTLFAAFDYISRKRRFLNWGFEGEYRLKSVDFNVSYEESTGSLDIRDVRYDMSYAYFSVFPDFSCGKIIKIYFNVGPYIGYLLSSEGNGTIYNKDSSGTCDTIIKSGISNGDFTSFDLGVKGRLGIETPIIPKLYLMAECQYGMGLNNISKMDFKNYKEFINTKDICVAVGLVFKFSKRAIIAGNTGE